MGLDKTVTCAYCEKIHRGKQVWYKQIEDYICLECNSEIKQRFKHQGDKVNVE